jgi:pyruvate dehydrogenase E2 component (dihydrolipoamide acetyltransferase)
MGGNKMTKVVLPELGEGIDKAIVSYWYYKEGDKVSEKDDLVELTTDKATFNLPSPCSGTLTEIFFREGDNVNVGEVLAIIEE